MIHFERHQPIKSAIGIGHTVAVQRSSIINARVITKEYTYDELNKMYDTIRSRGNISLDGVPITELSYQDKVYFNNQIVKGIKSSRKKIVKSKSSEFSKDKIYKAAIRGRDHFFEISFTGDKVDIDKIGRIIAHNRKYTQYKILLESIKEATEEETELYLATDKLHKMKVKMTQVQREIDKQDVLISEAEEQQNDTTDLLDQLKKLKRKWRRLNRNHRKEERHQHYFIQGL